MIEDFVVDAPTFGLLGALLNRLTIPRQLEAIFDFRRRRIEERPRARLIAMSWSKA